MMVERRTLERKEFTRALDFTVSTFQSGTMLSRGFGVDISCNGLGITSEYSPTPGTVLRISIPVEEIGIALPIFAEVAWVSPGREIFRAGLTFLRL
jgi:hypothetical protein